MAAVCSAYSFWALRTKTPDFPQRLGGRSPRKLLELLCRRRGLVIMARSRGDRG
jgi:hypothetical protein